MITVIHNAGTLALRNFCSQSQKRKLHGTFAPESVLFTELSLRLNRKNYNIQKQAQSHPGFYIGLKVPGSQSSQIPIRCILQSSEQY